MSLPAGDAQTPAYRVTAFETAACAGAPPEPDGGKVGPGRQQGSTNTRFALARNIE